MTILLAILDKKYQNSPTSVLVKENSFFNFVCIPLPSKKDYLAFNSILSTSKTSTVTRELSEPYNIYIYLLSAHQEENSRQN